MGHFQHRAPDISEYSGEATTTTTSNYDLATTTPLHEAAPSINSSIFGAPFPPIMEHLYSDGPDEWSHSTNLMSPVVDHQKHLTPNYICFECSHHVTGQVRVNFVKTRSKLQLSVR